MASPTSLTAIGRRMELDVGTRQGRLMKWILAHERVGLIWRHHKLKVAAALLAAAALRKLLAVRGATKAAADEAARRAVASTLGVDVDSAEAALAAAMEPDKLDAQQGIPASLHPKLETLFSSSDGSMAAKELTMSVVVAAATSFLHIRKALVLSKLMELSLHPETRAAWRRYALEFPFVAISIAVLNETIAHIQARTVLKWRKNCTRKIHDLYFSKMGYYMLANRGKELQVLDADVRICQDIKAMCEGNAGLYFSVANALVYTVFFGRAIMQGRSWRWSLVTPAFFVTALVSLQLAEPAARLALFGDDIRYKSLYTRLLSRMQLHAERICMLQGERFEKNLLRDTAVKQHETTHKLNWVMFPREMIEAAFFKGTGPPSLIEQMGWFLGSNMLANDVTKQVTAMGLQEHLPLDPWQKHSHSQGAAGTVIASLWAWFNTCTSWSTFVTALIALGDMEAGNLRVKELYASLSTLRGRARKENAKVFENGSVISFEGVSVNTPTGEKLIEDLTFSVDEGEMLLVCGHNGAGKSSIIRCLCGLWKVPKGKICRPGGAASVEENAQLRSEMYYLPQKPCNVLGSLSDQLTYPEKHELPEAELRRWLRYVDLEYLADRKISSDSPSRVPGGGNEIDWETLLSLGEQQALSIARLLYHRPRFAVLDECTSAVGKVLERRLFEVARELGIACVSITHRPALRDHHERMLRLTGHLAQDGKGWELLDLDPSITRRDSGLEVIGERPASKPRPDSLEEVHARMEAYMADHRNVDPSDGAEVTEHDFLEKRSAPYVARKAERGDAASVSGLVQRRWPTRLTRFVAVTKLGLQTQAQRRWALRKALLMGCLLRVRLSLGWSMWRSLLGQFVGGTCANRTTIFGEFIANFATTWVCNAVEQWFKCETRDFTRMLWKNISLELQERVMQAGNFLKAMSPPGPEVPAVENPIQRIQEVEKVTDVLAEQMMAVLIPTSQALWMLPSMVRGVGYWAPLLLASNFLVFRLAQYCAPDFTGIATQLSTLETRYQVLHSRLKGIAEPVAFSGAGAAERRIVEPRFDNLMNFEHYALRKQFVYNIVINFFSDYAHLPIWTHRLTGLRYVSSNNPVDPAGLTPTIVASNILWDRSTQNTQIWIQRCVLFVPMWKRIDATCCRILEMIEALDRVDGMQAKGPTWPAGQQDSGISVCDVDLVTKQGVCLVKNLSFELHDGEPLMITGPNAAGKSLLKSVMLGLWAPSGEKAQVLVPGSNGGRPPLATVMAATQRIYLPMGPLYEQLIYPEVFYGDELDPPFRILASQLPKAADHAGLSAFYKKLKGNVDMDAEKGSAVVTFARVEDMKKALAKPADNHIDGEEWVVDIMGAGNENPKLGHLPCFVRMRQCLADVGNEHILRREEFGWLGIASWEDVLSGGEQQRLCFARVLYHKPRFALLDECTSMVAADAEADLYRRLFTKWGITPLTLTQRMFMPDLYPKELRLGVASESGWQFKQAYLD